jgi:hypothetical protein
LATNRIDPNSRLGIDDDELSDATRQRDDDERSRLSAIEYEQLKVRRPFTDTMAPS